MSTGVRRAASTVVSYASAAKRPAFRVGFLSIIERIQYIGDLVKHLEENSSEDVHQREAWQLEQDKAAFEERVWWERQQFGAKRTRLKQEVKRFDTLKVQLSILRCSASALGTLLPIAESSTSSAKRKSVDEHVNTEFETGASHISDAGCKAIRLWARERALGC